MRQRLPEVSACGKALEDFAAGAGVVHLQARGVRRTHMQVQVLRGPRWLVVTVSDEGPGFTWHPNSERRNESGGWGLFLVDQIADCWGVECTASGARVWFEIAYEE